MNETRILGICISNRVKNAIPIQDLLTKYGCSIKTRLGLHEASDNTCSPTGLIIIELTGDLNEQMKLENELLKINGVEVQKMVFNN